MTNGQAIGSAPWNKRDAIAASVLMLLTFIVFTIRLHATIAAGVVDNVVLGADPAARFQALADSRYWRMGYQLHPLACVWTLVTAGPLRLLGAPAPIAAATSLGLAVSVGAAALFYTQRLLGVREFGALAMVALILSSFAMLTGLSVIDTYAVSFAAVSGALLSVIVIGRSGHGWRQTLLAGTVLAIPAAANLPTAAYALVFAGIVWDRTRRLRPTILAGGGSAAITGGAAMGWLLVTRFVLHFDSAGVIDTYASWAHFTHAEFGDGMASLFAFAFASPPGPLRCRYLATALGDYRGWRLAILGGWWLAIGAGALSSAFDHRHRGTIVAVSISSAIMLTFYLYFAPQVMLLYAPQFTPALAVILASPLRRHPGAWLPVAALATATAALNAPMLWTIDLTDFQAGCPAALQVNGAL